MTDDRKARLERAREITGDLKRAGGWDLTGYEDLLVDATPELVQWIFGDVRHGAVAVREDDAWRHLGRILSMTHHQPVQDVISVHSIDGIRRIKGITDPGSFDVEISGVGDRLHEIYEAGEKREFAIHMGSGIFSCQAFITELNHTFDGTLTSNLRLVVTGAAPEFHVPPA